MNGPTPAIDLLPQLAHDIVDLIRLRPGALLRLPTSACWGLAMTRLGPALWVAISIAGCARIAAQRRPWVHARARPDLTALAALLAARFPHAEPREAPGSFLFALDGAAGPCGRAVILAEASPARFPWMVAGTAHARAAAAAGEVIDEAEWQEHCALGAMAGDDLVSGGALPAALTAPSFMAAILAGAERAWSGGEEGRSRARAGLLLACAQERQRLSVLRRAWPGPSTDNPYGEPTWLAPAVCALEIERAVSAPGPGDGSDLDTDVDGPPAPGMGAMSAQRRPLTVPPVLPPVGIADEALHSGEGLRSGDVSRGPG